MKNHLFFKLQQNKTFKKVEIVVSSTIAIVVNEPSMFEGQYERYLMNRLREELPYSEVPIRLLFTKRQRKSLEELKQDGRTATM